MDATRLKYLPLFVLEARKHLRRGLDGLDRMERGERGEVLSGTFRELFTLKGAAWAMRLTSIFTLSHYAEDLLYGYYRGELEPEEEGLRLLRQGLERLEELVSEADAGLEPTRAEALEAAFATYLRTARHPNGDGEA